MAKNPNFPADKRGYTCCIGCTQKQVVELHCHICDHDKGVDSFSKAQRKNPDHAVCWKCAKEREEMEPGESDNDISDDSRDGLSDAGSGEVSLFSCLTRAHSITNPQKEYSFPATSSHAGGTTLPGTYSSRNTSGGGVSLASTTGAAPSSVAPSSRASGWAIPSAASSTVDGGGFETVNNRSSKPAASSRGGFNPSKYKPAASVASSSRGRGQWAKIPAVRSHFHLHMEVL